MFICKPRRTTSNTLTPLEKSVELLVHLLCYFAGEHLIYSHLIYHGNSEP